MVSSYIASLLFFAAAAMCNGLMDRMMKAYMINPEIDKGWWSFNPNAKWLPNKIGIERANNILLAKIGIKTIFLTDNCNDAWHSLKSTMIVLICLTITTHRFSLPYGLDLVVFGIVWNMAFNVVYLHKL